MSITHELREYFGKSKGMFTDHVLAIADRIDDEHERAMAAAALIAGVPMTDENMAEYGWIRLPKDADNEYIRVGDVMDSKVDYLFDGRPFEVRALVLCEDEWEAADGRYGNRYKPNSLRHHHAPTVEDVLREFALAVCKDDALTIRKDVVDEYAAKLRLAGDAE